MVAGGSAPARYSAADSDPDPKAGKDPMSLGYDGKLFILAFDHRGSFQKKMFGIQGDPDAEQTRTISDAKHLIFEGLVPGTPEQLESVGGDTERYDSELRPELMRRTIAEIQDAGVEVDIWKIEGVDERSDCEMLAEQTRSGPGREGVVCVVLGRGASQAKVEHWLREAAPVDGFVGFAIGRSIWWDALKGMLDGSLPREDAAREIADKYLHFIQVYEAAERGSAVR